MLNAMMYRVSFLRKIGVALHHQKLEIKRVLFASCWQGRSASRDKRRVLRVRVSVVTFSVTWVLLKTELYLITSEGNLNFREWNFAL